MGLLEDAIRDHMKMKRDRGASMDTISRIEDEAFGSGAQQKAPSPITAKPKEPTDDRAADSKAQEPQETYIPSLDEVEANTDAEEEPAVAGDSDLEAEIEQGDSSAFQEQLPEDDSDRIGEGPSQDRPLDTAEHLLKETPEFLEDTPEGERLWFEQRPPKDFDFND